MDIIEGFTFEKEGFYDFNNDPLNKNDIQKNIFNSIKNIYSFEYVKKF